MKKMISIWLMLVLFSVLAIHSTTYTTHSTPYTINQSLAQLPQPAMRSTSALCPTGSALPQAAISGVSTTYSSPHSPRRAKMEEENPFGDDNVSGTTNPQEPGTPIGDAIFPLLLCAILYLLYRHKQATRPLRPGC